MTRTGLLKKPTTGSPAYTCTIWNQSNIPRQNLSCKHVNKEIAELFNL